MRPLLVTLLALVDSGYWGLDRLKILADDLIVRTKQPADWLISVSMSASRDAAMEALTGEMRRRGMGLPEDFGQILAGFVFLRNKGGQITSQELVSQIVRVFDGYDLRPDLLEGLADLEAPEETLEWVRCSETRDLLSEWASDCSVQEQYVTSDAIYENERELIEA